MDSYRYYRLGEEEKRSLVARLAEQLERHGEVELALVFGSFLELPEFRDIDIAVYTRSDDIQLVIDLANELEEALGLPVDVVPLRELSPRFRHSILTRGLVVLERVPGLYEALLSQTLDELMLVEVSA